MSDDNPLDLPALQDAPVSTGVGIGAIALSLAMKYHDTNTVKDGAMYQQLKLEGANIRTLGLEDVFETAKRMEQHLLGASDRIATMVIEAVVHGSEKDGEEERSKEELGGD